MKWLHMHFERSILYTYHQQILREQEQEKANEFVSYCQYKNCQKLSPENDKN